MNLSNLIPTVTKTLKSNSPEIFTALGVSGVVATAYLTGKASFQAAYMIMNDESVGGTHGDPRERLKERTRLVWKCYIPAGMSGLLTVGCIIAASKTNNRRTAAAVTAYSLTEKAFSEYREKVIEQIGKGKERTLRNNIAADKVLKKTESNEIRVIGSGQVMCCELFTQRYFRSDMETLRKIQNDINARIVADPYVTLDEFYERVGLPYTSNSNRIGWEAHQLLELQFSTVLSSSGEPCLAFDYNYTKPLK